MANGPVTSFAVPNYSGMLYTKSNTNTPFLNMIGATRYTNHVEFAVSQEYALETPGQPAISETASLTAPTATHATRSPHSNVTQIFHRAVEVSYAKMSNMGTMSGINAAGQQPNPQDELDFQIAVQMQNIANSIEYTFLNGTYQKAATDSEPNKTRGILTAIETNAIAGGGALTKTMLRSLFKSIYDNGGRVNGSIILVNSFQKGAISDLYENGMSTPASRTVAGINVTDIVTDFGNIGVALAPSMPQDTLLIFNPEVCHAIEQPTPGKGNFFYEELAKTGAGERGQIFGQIGLDYGPEWMHGKITGLATE